MSINRKKIIKSTSITKESFFPNDFAHKLEKLAARVSPFELWIRSLEKHQPWIESQHRFVTT